MGMESLSAISGMRSKPAPAPVTSPQALKLAVEPQANVLRYDQLREVRYAS